MPNHREVAHRDDLHRHRQRADARHDRAAPRLRNSGKFEGGKLMLFFGARTQQELPYFGPLQNLPKDFIDINFAFSREPGQPERYVQDADARARGRPGRAAERRPRRTSTSAA